jgi:HTH-type transcriptional regulator/antitoxin HigA
MAKSNIKPIRSKADYEAALADVEQLWGAKSGTAKGDRLDVDPPDPIDAIKFRMEQMGLTRKDLEPLIGTRTRVAEVLNGRRRLSIAMIRRLHEKLGGAGCGKFSAFVRVYLDRSLRQPAYCSTLAVEESS